MYLLLAKENTRHSTSSILGLNILEDAILVKNQFIKRVWLVKDLIKLKSLKDGFQTWHKDHNKAYTTPVELVLQHPQSCK
jgi:hypothetical protein